MGQRERAKEGGRNAREREGESKREKKWERYREGHNGSGREIAGGGGWGDNRDFTVAGNTLSGVGIV